jgi:2-phospho-L-lactate/phosphoenolpyruvate guanylyltransferase
LKEPWVEALVPVKGFAVAKERLSALLSPAERSELARAMLSDVIEALESAPEIAQVWVISPDSAVRELAGRASANALAEPGGCSGLNQALEAGRRMVMQACDADHALLVVPMDVPRANAAAISEFVSSPARPLVRLCPSDDGGTNALLQFPPDAIPFAFGINSAMLHEQEALERGLPCERRDITALHTDADRPEDLARLLTEGCGLHTTAVAARLGLLRRMRRDPLTPRRGASP